MRNNVEEMVIEEAKHLLKTKCTIRECARAFKMSKSTIHKDIRYRLPLINLSLHNEVLELLRANWNERGIRGGAATKQVLLERKLKGKI